MIEPASDAIVARRATQPTFVSSTSSLQPFSRPLSSMCGLEPLIALLHVANLN